MQVSLNQILKAHLRDNSPYHLLAQDTEGLWWDRHDVIYLTDLFAILTVWDTKALIEDPGSSTTTRWPASTWFKDFLIDFHHPDSFKKLDKQLQAMRRLVLGL
jgi:hypothetical protein